MLSTASSSSSTLTLDFAFALPFLPVDFGSVPSSLAALAFFGVLLAFLLGVLLSTPPVESVAVEAVLILVRLRVFQRARRDCPDLYPRTSATLSMSN